MDELDSYSRTVSAVAAKVTPRVAAVRLGRGTGSAVVVPGDGVLVTNAHVVADARRGRADFLDGVQASVRVLGADRIVFGSDYAPVPAIPPVIENILAAVTSPAEADAIFHANGRALLERFGVDQRLSAAA